MPKRPPPPRRVREPAQVYLEADDRELASPGRMLRYLDELAATPPTERELAARHDGALAEEYLGRRSRRR